MHTFLTLGFELVKQTGKKSRQLISQGENSHFLQFSDTGEMGIQIGHPRT